MKCVKCEKEIKEENFFCPYCGTKVEPETKKLQCQSCNCEIEANMLFCPSCGCEIINNERKRFNQPVVEDSSRLSKNSNVTSNSQPKNTIIQTETTVQKERKLKTATVLSAIAAVLFVIVSLCVLLLPLFSISYSETIDGETVSKKTGVSLLVFVIESIKSIVSISNTSSYMYLEWIYLFLRLIVTITIIFLIISSIKLAVEKIRNLIKYEEYKTRELAKDSTAQSAEKLLKSFRVAYKGNILYQLVADLGLIILLFGYGTVVWGTVIAIVIMAIIAYVVEKVATWIKKQALV